MTVARTTLRRNHRKLCIGDLRDRVILHVRKITEPSFEARDFNLAFQDGVEVWALVKTTAGRTFFDGVSQDRPVSHTITIRFDKDVTSETWIELEDGGRLDIVNVEDLEERHEYLRLLCSDRGSVDVEAAKS